MRTKHVVYRPVKGGAETKRRVVVLVEIFLGRDQAVVIQQVVDVASGAVLDVFEHLPGAHQYLPASLLLELIDLDAAARRSDLGATGEGELHRLRIVQGDDVRSPPS